MTRQMLILINIILFTIFLSFSCSKNAPTVTSSENIEPICHINLPSEGSSFEIGSSIQIRVIANDEDGNIEKVKFYVDDQLKNEDTEYPFQYFWDTIGGSNGEKVIYVEAIDDDGASASDSVTVIVGWVYQQPEIIDDGWETDHLDNVGLDKQNFDQLMIDIHDHPEVEIHSMLIIKNGKLVFEEYFPGYDFNYNSHNFHGTYIDFDRDTPHNTHSATKSIVSTLIGIAIEQGFITSVDDSLFSYFEPYSYLMNEENGKIIIEHLLTMTSGFEWNEWDVPPGDPNYDTYLFNTAPDPIEYILSKPIITEPGTSFYYNGAGVDLLGELITRSTGIRVDHFSGQYLFGPLGIANYEWQSLPSGLICAHGDIYLTPRSMAKYGYLLLNDGEWNGNQIVSEDWVNRSISNHVQLPPIGWAETYGYLIWRNTFQYESNSYESFSAKGWGGQEIIVIPELDLVAVFTGASYLSDPPCDYIVQNYILPSITN